MLSYWETRANEVSNPILQCRYSGLVWDFSLKIRGKKANISLAYKFIDSIIKMAELGGDPVLKYKFERALKLAVSINDQKRILSLKDTIIKYEDTHSEDNKPGTWGYSFDLLIGNKDLYKKIQLKEEQESQIIKKLEEKLIKFSDKDSKSFDSYYLDEHIISRLVFYYNKNQNNRSNLKRVLLIYRDSFLYGLKKGLVISGSFWLEKIRKILFQYRFSQEAKVLEEKLRFYQTEDLKSLNKFETSIKFSKENIDNCIKQLDEVSLSQALNIIAIDIIPDKDKHKNSILEIAKKHPLAFMFQGNIIDHTGRKVSEIGPLEKDLDGHIVHEIKLSLQLIFPVIELGLNHLEKNKSLNADKLLEHLFKSPFFLETRRQIIKKGLIAYFNKDYISSCSILIPQIEAIIRNIISIAGGAIYESTKSLNEKGFKLRPLGALLRDEIFYKIFEELNKNIPLYFQILLTDKRGFNFRNSICHGDFPDNHFNKFVATYIILILLIFRFLKKRERFE